MASAFNSYKFNIQQNITVNSSQSGYKVKRVDQIKPLLIKEVVEKYKEKEYFTRDHLLTCSCLRQYSTSYKISLIGKIVRFYINEGKLLEYSLTDIAVNTPANRRLLSMQIAEKTPTYSGSYTTRSADELMSRQLPIETFDTKWLANWLECLSHLAAATRYQYSRRIIEDLVRRGILLEHFGFQYSVYFA